MSGRNWDRDYGSFAEFYKHAYGQHLSGLHRLGSGPATVIEGVQSAGDWSDAPIPDLSIAWLPSKPTGFACDLGAGRFTGRMQTNDAILIAPGAGSAIQMHGAHICRVVSLPYAWVRSWGGAEEDGVPEDGDFGPLHGRLLRDARLQRVLDALWTEAQGGGSHGRLYGDGLLLQLVGLLSLLSEEPNPALVAGGLAPWQVRRVSEYLEDRLTDDVTLAELAELVGLSTFHLCRAFKQSTGLPPHRWRHRKRMERGRELLKNTSLSITEIAAAVGYDDPSRFASGFRKAFGLSPTDYRRERLS